MNSSLRAECDSFASALLRIDKPAAREILEEAAHECGPLSAAELLVTPVLADIGEAWRMGSLALAQLYMASRICEDLMEEMLPVFAPGRIDAPRIAVGVLEDHHALGKRVVTASLRAAGFDVLDYGHGLTVENFVSRSRLDEVQILLVSTLMLPAALRVAALMEALEADAQARPAGRPWVIVGGAPFIFDEKLYGDVGADSVGSSASQSVELVQHAMTSLPGGRVR